MTLTMINRDSLGKYFRGHDKGQSAVELAIFGSILLFVISLIWRQGLSASNYMNTELKATRYSMSKSFEMSRKGIEKPGRNSGSTMIIEDRLSGDFTNKFGSRDRVPMTASGSAMYTNQLSYPLDVSDCDHWATNGVSACDTAVLPHLDVWINGQRIPFTTSGFRIITLPQSEIEAQALGIGDCTLPHPNDSRCWDKTSDRLILQKMVLNYPNGGFKASNGGFDVNFDGVSIPNVALQIPSTQDALAFSWQWVGLQATGTLPNTGREPIDVDGDFLTERILDSTVDTNTNRTATVLVIDSKAGDIDSSSGNAHRANFNGGLQQNSQMYSLTREGTVYRIQEGKIYSANDNQFIRNANINDHVDIVQRQFNLSNNTGRFCDGANPRSSTSTPPWDDALPNPVEGCGHCFSGNIQKTCFDPSSNILYVRSRIANKNGRNWFTRTEVRP